MRAEPPQRLRVDGDVEGVGQRLPAPRRRGRPDLEVARELDDAEIERRLGDRLQRAAGARTERPRVGASGDSQLVWAECSDGRGPAWRSTRRQPRAQLRTERRDRHRSLAQAARASAVRRLAAVAGDRPPVPTPGQQLALGLADSANDKPDDDTESSPRPRRLGWAKLLARVFAADVTVCRKCGGRISRRRR